MIILDTDHLSELQRNSAPGGRLRGRLASPAMRVATTIITVEEQIRGRLATIRRGRTALDEIAAYERLLQLIEFLAKCDILPFDRASALVFDGFPARMVQRVGPMDCRIAAIAWRTTPRY